MNTNFIQHPWSLILKLKKQRINTDVTKPLSTKNRKARKHVYAHVAKIKAESDAFIHYVLVSLFIGGLLFALYYDTWLIGLSVGSISLIAYYSAKWSMPDSNLYQYVLSAVLGIFMAQYIFQMHGMFEMHFLAFIGSALLITYQKWRLQIPLAIVVILHHAVFGYLQYIGHDDVYFSQLDYMTLNTFLIHCLFATIIFFISGLWSYNLKKSNESQIEQSIIIGKLEEKSTQQEALLQMGESLVESNELLKEAQKMGRAGNWSFDMVNNTIHWSEGMRIIKGVDEHFNPTFSAFIDMVHPEDKDMVLTSINEMQHAGNTAEMWYRYIRRDDKAERIFHSIMHAEKNKENVLIRMYGISQDVTEMKLAEAALEKNLQDLEARVEERTRELTKKSQSLIDSIHYSKRIQTAMLPRHTQLEEIFPQSFLISCPKDIVSGDFFWCHQTRHKKIIAIADCTGHGVPGALMSIICNNLLKEVIIDHHIENPSEILEILDKKLNEAIRGGEVEVNDGMDIGVFVVDSYFKEIYYSGAFRPLFYFNAEGEVVELQGNPFPIGGALQATKKFDTHRFAIVPGQNYYISSDGYYSQFGGPKDKKFMKKKFRETLSLLRSKNISDQKEFLLDTFNQWKGDAEQTDDVMVLGIQV